MYYFILDINNSYKLLLCCLRLMLLFHLTIPVAIVYLTREIYENRGGAITYFSHYV